jgi:hypothetical protein
MQIQTAAGASAPLSIPFRPALGTTRPTRKSGGSEAEVQRLKAELAKVKGELRELKLATQQFVRSML